MTKRMTIFGASGAQGAPVVAAALAAGYAVRAVSRSATDAVTDGRVEHVRVDLADPAGVAHALDGVDAAFVHIPIGAPPDVRMHHLATVLDAAKASGLPKLVFSTSGHTNRRFGDSPVVAANAEMAERVLASGVPSVVLAPTVYLENLRLGALTPRLREMGVLDYPPLTPDRPFSWTSWYDQAALAVAAVDRPELVGRVHEIATPSAVTGPQLATLLAAWVGHPVRFVSTTPAQFAQRLLELSRSPEAARALAALYDAIAKLPIDGATVDTAVVERDFGVRLTPIEAHIASWRA